MYNSLYFYVIFNKHREGFNICVISTYVLYADGQSTILKDFHNNQRRRACSPGVSKWGFP